MKSKGHLAISRRATGLRGNGTPAQNSSLTCDASEITGGDEVGADVLVPVDGLGKEEMQVVQGHGGDEGQHSILVWDLH